ncbi:hypothetical protein OIV83_000422 [Microbotryomycetes sp. JL201]|nr:hypothetical protein OIV83_000422 [Microbotryomycetes sp. JL201]
MLNLLDAESCSPTDPIGPCFEFVLKEQVLGTLVKLVLEGNNSSLLRTLAVQWYSKAIVALPETFLVHRSIHKPLVKLLNKCIETEVGEFHAEEEAVVSIMVVIAERIRTYPQLLAIFLKGKSSAPSADMQTNQAQTPPTTPSRAAVQRVGSNASAASTSDRDSIASPSKSSFLGYQPKREHDFLLFAYMLRFVHREGKVGDDSRAGLLSLIDIAMGVTKASGHVMLRTDSSTTVRPAVYPSTAIRDAAAAFAEYLLDSDFAEVLGAGVAALFGLLPSKLAIRPALGSTPSKTDSSDGQASIARQAMVLGGLGALGEDENPETAAEERLKEEDSLLANGVGLAGTEDFCESLDAWLKLVEFTQEVLTRLDSPLDGLRSSDRAIDDEDQRQRRATEALSKSILSLLRTLFLQAVLYPSILESSDQDGSSVAVLSYLDALLNVVADGTTFEATIMEFLTEDDFNDQTPNTSRKEELAESQSIVNVFLSPASNRVRRRKSSAMLIIERATRQDRKSDYYIDTGRFTLKDLLAVNLNSTAAPTVIAATKLLRTLLQRHDRWANMLLDVTLDDAATSFPIAQRQEVVADELELDEDPDVFVYHPRTARQTREGILSHVLTPLSPVATIQAHHDALEVMVSLLTDIDLANSHLTLDSIVSASTAFSDYLLDAESAIAFDLGFRRGVAVNLSGNDAEPKKNISVERKRSSFFGHSTRLTPRQLCRTETGVRHRLKPDAAVVGALLDLLSRFFTHSPDVNLSLTAAIAAMALSPYRSLDDWLLPKMNGREPIADQSRMKRGRTSERPISSDGDDNSDDFEPGANARIDSQKPIDELFSPTKAALVESDSVLAILSALARSIQRYRALIPQFDLRLTERRQGLFFADNLTDALELDSAEGLSLPSPTIQKGPIDLATPLPLPSTPQRSMGIASFITGRPKHARLSSLSSTFSTPQRLATQATEMRRSSSANEPVRARENQHDAMRGGQQTQSPFQAHYRQTGVVTVHPVVVSTPRMSHKRAAAKDYGDDFEEVSPSRGSQGHISRSSVGASSDVSSSHAVRTSVTDGPAPTVSLSTILDNVILLEEFIKELAAIVQVRRSLGIDATRVL